jgi:hypothetical protein
MMRGVDGLPTGRAPQHGGQTIARDVIWWYRAKIKRPADSIHAIADEYAKVANRVTEARSVVQDGIFRAETLLNREIVGDGAADGH